jgi:2,4-dienoyl-CoA reductase-like NADH-dependent reductase (Old Yellow Enzyme family)
VDVFEPAPLGPLRLRNRVIKAATYEGMSPGGVASDALVEFHRQLAAGGVGMTTVAYCAVMESGRTFAEQLMLGEASQRGLARLTRAVHDEGGKASLQLGHAGSFSKLRTARGPSMSINAYGVSTGVPIARAMEERDIRAVIDAFGESAKIAVGLGFDALELHLGHGYLLSQFLSPASNRRKDAWGGSLANRLRLPLAAIERVRESVGSSVAILVKTNLDDGFEGGLTIDESVEIARAIEASGWADAIVPSGGFTSKTPFYLLRGGLPLSRMAHVQKERLTSISMRLIGGAILDRYEFEELFFLPLARRVRAAVKMPVALLGGIVSREGMAEARREGFDFVVLGRALIADPDLVLRMQRGELERTRCNACNECVAEMDDGGVRCVLDGPR